MYKNILYQISKYIALTSPEKEEFTGILQGYSLKKKEFLIEAGQLVKNQYYVVKGCLNAYYLDELGNKHILQFAIEDWWISDFQAFFDGSPAQLFVEAIEDSVLLGISNDALETLFFRIPKFERFFRIITTKAFVSLRVRVLSFLQNSGTERYIEFCTTYPKIEERITNYQIANYLGIQPESLSRIRKEVANS
ncbi:MAG: hypothetical protein CVU03_05455 [Bacteroidetes bacterium HGW-Bacteroidetes-2]|jgi:CRP-like cAMP-binding protein|nr:MAG: hypothetical protein CVU03_05455 [Bacteroidetes bacterium HGW-Bacteroidetes-2]